MNLVKGEIFKNGKVALISQDPFLINDTLQQNILFGKQLDQTRYENVLKICQLEHDLEMLAGGDQTEIGERGINLSGGQKQRIAIARAVYSDADIYLIDDCLSALDAHVGNLIFDQVLEKYLKNKTRIIATHYLHFLDKLDEVILMDAGKIQAQGKFKDVQNT